MANVLALCIGVGVTIGCGYLVYTFAKELVAVRVRVFFFLFLSNTISIQKLKVVWCCDKFGRNKVTAIKQRTTKMPGVSLDAVLCGALMLSAVSAQKQLNLRATGNETGSPNSSAALATPCCSWDKCGTCSSTTPYCESTEQACQVDCKGQWCPNGAVGPSGYDTPNVCDPSAKSAPQVAYACMDWNVGSKAMTDAANSAGMGDTHFFGVGSFGGDGTNMGKCYEVSFDGVSKKGLLQVRGGCDYCTTGPLRDFSG